MGLSLRRRPTEQEWKWGSDAVREVAEYAAEIVQADYRTRTAEPLRVPLHQYAADAVQFIEEVGMPNVKVHLDTFHMIREEDNVVEAMRTTGQHLGYFHACENRRGIPGTGLVPWKDVFRTFKEIGYDGC